jgi:hypothetical protein
MTPGDDGPVDRLQSARDLDVDAFEATVREEADVIREHIADGTFDNPEITIGLEHEFYAVAADTHRLRRVPRDLLRCFGFEQELGLHNAELSTGVQPLNPPGVAAMRRDVEAKVTALQRLAADEDIRLVADGMWTVGPEGNTTEGYLTESTRSEGLTLGVNVTNAVRYHGFGDYDGDRSIRGQIDLPGATMETDNAAAGSLTSSIQPHYQCRRAADIPECHGLALRIAGPLLALAANSPFLPPDLYDDPDPDRETLIEEGHAEVRVPVYEQMMNPPDAPPKVRFPGDIDAPGEFVDRVVEDAVLVPADFDRGDRFDDAFVHFRHKHGSYWRWVRPVFGGASEDAANARIEFRPLPGQPTIPDTAGFVAAFGGLLTGLRATDHPVAGLDWETARENFYAAATDGLDADLAWITADGERTSDTAVLFADLFDAAVAGLARHGFDREQAARWLDPLRERVARGCSPAGWKRQFVASRLADGASATEAIEAMQRAYIDIQRDTLADGHFADWPDPEQA